MITPEFGLLGTTTEQMWYLILKEIQKNNELLEKLVPKEEVKKSTKKRGAVDDPRGND